MKGQIGLAEYMESLKADTLRARYPIPKLAKKYLDEERWVDEWHYCDEELPKEAGIYYTVTDGGEHYHYHYQAFAFGRWWTYAGYGDKWLLAHDERRAWMEPFAWVQMPLEYQKDEHYRYLLNIFPGADNWEREKKLEEYRKWRED